MTPAIRALVLSMKSASDAGSDDVLVNTRMSVLRRITAYLVMCMAQAGSGGNIRHCLAGTPRRPVNVACTYSPSHLLF